MDLLNIPETLKLLADVGSTVLLAAVVWYLARMRDRNEQRDAKEHESWLSVLNNISTQAVTTSATSVEMTNTLQAITRTLTETNPMLYKGYWQGAVNQVTEHIDKDTQVRTGQFEAVTLKIDGLPTTAQIASAVKAQMDPQIKVIHDAIRDLRVSLQAPDASLPADVVREMRQDITQIYRLLNEAAAREKARQPQDAKSEAAQPGEQVEDSSGPATQ